MEWKEEEKDAKTLGRKIELPHFGNKKMNTDIFERKQAAFDVDLEIQVQISKGPKIQSTCHSASQSQSIVVLFPCLLVLYTNLRLHKCWGVWFLQRMCSKLTRSPSDH